MRTVQVQFASTAERFGAEVEQGSKNIGEYLRNKGANMNAKFSVNGALLGDDQVRNFTFDDLVSAGYVPEGGTVIINETIKTVGA